MATTAEVYGIGARAPYAQPRASEYDMKERVRLSGLFPRVRNEPMSTQLQALMKDFEKNAALTGILERQRRLEERIQYEMKSREAVAAANVNLAPPFRTGTASFATSAAVANKLAAPDAADVMTGAVGKVGKAGKAGKAKAGAVKVGRKAANAKVRIRKPPKTAEATAPVVSVVGVSQEGGSSGSTDVPVLAGFAVQPVAVDTLPEVPPKRRSKSRQRDT